MSQEHLSREKKSLRTLKKNLREIYSNEQGEKQNLQHFTKKTSSGFTKLLTKTLFILSFVSLLLWGGYFIFLKNAQNNQDHIQTTITYPQNVKSGEKIKLEIRYENKSAIPLASLEARVHFPNTFHVLSALPDITKDNTWNIGSLAPKSDGVIQIQGMFLSQVPSNERIQAIMSYKPANFSSIFQNVESVKIPIEQSVLETTIESPEHVLGSEEITYKIHIKNTSKEPQYNIQITPIIPNEFTIKSSDPVFEESEKLWLVPHIEAEKEKILLLKGIYSASSSGKQTIIVKTGFLQNDEILLQNQTESNINTLGGSLNLHLIINGSDQDQAVELGKTLHISFDYTNKSSDPAESVSLFLEFKGEEGKTLPIDWEKTNIEKATRKDQIIEWNKNTNPTLGLIKPNDSGLIDLQLPLLKESKTTISNTLTIVAKAQITKLGSITTTSPIELTPIILTMNSNTSFSAIGRYFADDGQPLGSGSLPPKVGNITTYRIYWNIENSLHELQQIDVSAVLPKNVTWIEKKYFDIGKLEFNPTTRRIKWTVEKLPPTITNASSWFDLSLLPTKEDLSISPILLSETSFVAIDASTKKQVTSTSNEISTLLELDTFAKSKGIVVK